MSTSLYPSRPKDYEWKGTIRETKLTTKILAHVPLQRQDVIVEIKNMEMMWDMNEIEKYFGQIHEIMNIRHDNVLSPVHTFQHKSEIWIIFPLLSGGPLSELFSSHYVNGLPDEDVVATILYDVACGLNAIHSSQLVHRNIRSSSLHMSKSSGKALLKNFLSLKTFKWEKHRKYSLNNNNRLNFYKQIMIEHKKDDHDDGVINNNDDVNNDNEPQLNRPNTAITEEQYPFTDPLLLDPSSDASFISGDIYSFGILAMELCFGYPPPTNSTNINNRQHNKSKSMPLHTANTSILDTKGIRIPSFNDYRRKCPFSPSFQDLVKKCLNTLDRITLKQILCHRFFTNRRYQYEKVIQCIQPIRSTESKILPSLNFRKESIYRPNSNKNIHKLTDSAHSITTLLSKDSIELYGDRKDGKKEKKKDNKKYVKIIDDSWDFDVDCDDDDGLYDKEPALILDAVEYGDDTDNKIREIDEEREDTDDDDEREREHTVDIRDLNDLKYLQQNKPSLVHHSYSGTYQSTISRLSPLASSRHIGPTLPISKHPLPNIIKLNIGGSIYTTTLVTLRKYDTMLSKKFSGDYDAEYDETTDSYFIDRDGRHFNHILNYLRTGKLIISRPYNKDNKFDGLFYKELYEEVCYYQVSNLINILNPDNIYFYSKILPNEHYVHILKKWISNPTATIGINIKQSKEENAEEDKKKEEEKEDEDRIKNINFMQDLKRRVVCNQKWRLIYRASDDGFAASEFHRHCDLLGPTITLIHANNRIFGGYTDISWKSDSKDKYAATKQECINTFIFVMNITNKVNDLKAFKWNFIEKYYSSYGSNLPVAHERNIGPAFGWYHILKKRGNDENNMAINKSQDGIVIGDKCNIQNNSCWTFCAYFNTPKSSADLAGSKYFFVKDIEVYQISFNQQ